MFEIFNEIALDAEDVLVVAVDDVDPCIDFSRSNTVVQDTRRGVFTDLHGREFIAPESEGDNVVDLARARILRRPEECERTADVA